jgi:hypothetical protein
VPYQIVFVPNDFSNTYVISHWTNLGDYSLTTDAPFATNLINSTQVLPAPSSQDANAAYAASPSALVQINGAGEISYMTNPVGSDYTVSSGATWTQMSYTLAGTGGSVVGGSSASASASASSSASASASSASGSSSASRSASASTSGSASRSAASSASAASGASTPSSTSAAGLGAKRDLAGLGLGLAALGLAMLL